MTTPHSQGNAGQRPDCPAPLGGPDPKQLDWGHQDSPAPLPLIDEIEARMHALLKLRRQMLALHARLEYLRLMLRLSGPALPR